MTLALYSWAEDVSPTVEHPTRGGVLLVGSRTQQRHSRQPEPKNNTSFFILIFKYVHYSILKGLILI